MSILRCTDIVIALEHTTFYVLFIHIFTTIILLQSSLKHLHTHLDFIDFTEKDFLVKSTFNQAIVIMRS